MIPESEWRWFGDVAHFICGHDCRFHLATQVGGYLVSTVGKYLPDSTSWDSHASAKGVHLTGRGDARRYDFLDRVGYVEIGHERTYETMVFLAGVPCVAEGCACGLPNIASSELDFEGYNDAGSATAGHYEMCRKYAAIDQLETSENE